ncbi:MAG: hypothetical protein SF028_07405 [Candidatus Sumerlaeia bacterium]|nr:hypothetical protein [Candidatus Sumerlaeia bacterium]
MWPAAESTAWKNPFAFPFVTVSWSLSKNFVFEPSTILSPSQ